MTLFCRQTLAVWSDCFRAFSLDLELVAGSCLPLVFLVHCPDTGHSLDRDLCYAAGTCYAPFLSRGPGKCLSVAIYSCNFDLAYSHLAQSLLRRCETFPSST